MSALKEAPRYTVTCQDNTSFTDQSVPASTMALQRGSIPLQLYSGYTEPSTPRSTLISILQMPTNTHCLQASFIYIMCTITPSFHSQLTDVQSLYTRTHTHTCTHTYAHTHIHTDTHTHNTKYVQCNLIMAKCELVTFTNQASDVTYRE